MVNVNTYLIHCKYDYYCQGTDTTEGIFLVYAENFPDACRKLEQNIHKVSGLPSSVNAREFENRTVL